MTEIEAEICAAAVAALRRRAARQAAIARAGVEITESGVAIRTGEGAIAAKRAAALGAIADELEREGEASWPTSA